MGSVNEIEFIRHIAPELENQMWESRNAHMENQHRERMERATRREMENRAFIAEQNAKAEQTITHALGVIRNGGNLENQTIVFYESRYHSGSCSIVNYLMQEYGVQVPPRTQGWIQEKLASAQIKNGKCEKVRYYREKGAQCSQKFFGYMDELIAKVSNR